MVTIYEEIAHDMAYVLRQKCIAEFRASVDIAESGCWEWRRARAEFGYGVWPKRSLLPVATRQTVLAHRVAAWLWLGLLAELINGNPRGAPKVQVLHRCDYPCCCNPDHLYLGSAADNVRDMVERGRLTLGRLTDEQVVEIRRLALGGLTYAEIGRRFGVGVGLARAAAVGKTYGQVPYPTALARPRGRRWRTSLDQAGVVFADPFS